MATISSILLILSLSPVKLVTAEDWGSEVIFVTAEAGHFEGSWDISPLIMSISSLELLTDKIEHSTFFSSMANPTHKKLVSWLIDHIRLTLLHTKTTLEDLGFSLEDVPSERVKRAPFSFIGDIQSSLFGTVTESEYNSFKEIILKSFTIYQAESSLVHGLISDNRKALIETLQVVQTNSENFEKTIELITDDMKLISRLFQASFSLNAIERFIITLSSIKASCDRNFISRHIMPPSALSTYLLKLSDQITGHNPVFNTKQINVYYKLRLSVSTISGLTIKQITTIPIISVNDQFTVSHAQCQVSHICLENNLGTMTIPTTDFLRCHGATIGGLPTICPFRPCLTSHISVCRAFNLTSFLVSTSKPFEVVLNCDNYDKTVTVANVTYLNVPIHCAVTGSSLKIPVLHTMFSNGEGHNIFQIPFQLTDQDLTFNSSGLDNSLKRQLSLKGVRDLIKTKVPRPVPIQIGNQVLLHKGLSIGALSLSSTVIIFITIGGILLCACKAKIAGCLHYPNE